MINFETIKKIPFVDTHVHRIHPNRAPSSFISIYPCIPGLNQRSHALNSLMYHQIINGLRTEYGMPENSTVEEVEQERDRRYQADPCGYFSNLIQKTNVDLYLLENGSPIFRPAFTEDEIEWFNNAVPVNKQRSIVRIERILDDLLPLGLSFTEVLDTFHHDLPAKIESQHAVGIKTCAAYYGGLKINTAVTKSAAAASYEKILNGKQSHADIKDFYDYFLMSTLQYASKYDLPIQIHTGFGAARFVDFNSSNPVSLSDFLLCPEVLNKIKIVLLHAGHPYEEITSYFVSQFDNVYSDFSSITSTIGANSVYRLRALLERAPFNKIMYGSDATNFPEMYWFAPNCFRMHLHKLLNSYIADNMMSESRALEIAEMIMYKNAYSCYTKL